MRQSLRKSVLYICVARTPPPFSFPSSSTFCTAAAETSKEHSFTVNYLISNFGFSAEVAKSAFKSKLRFQSSEKPDSVVAFFRNYGFSDSHIRSIILRRPVLLLSNTQKTILPKLDYLCSKGASFPQLACIISTNPNMLLRSLENCLIPNYNLLREFFDSDQRTIISIKRNPLLLTKKLQPYITFMLDIGLRMPSIVMLLRDWPWVINCDMDCFSCKIDKIRELGIDPCRAAFVPAMYAKELPKSMWDSKVELYKKLGWTHETIHAAFLKHPFCMLISERKIAEVFDYFVNHLGWEPQYLARYPNLLSMSLKKRIVPRASVLQFLRSRDLIKKGVKYLSAYYISEKMFLQKYVTCFKDDAPQVLKLYEEKMNLS